MNHTTKGKTELPCHWYRSDLAIYSANDSLITNFTLIHQVIIALAVTHQAEEEG